MADEKHTFGTARIRLEEIAAEVRKKDTSLEKSLDLLEEGVRLANICTELVDHTDMSEPSRTETVDAESLNVESGESAPEASTDEMPEEDDVARADVAGDGFEEEYDDEDEPSDVASVE